MQDDDGFNEDNFKGLGEDPAPANPAPADPNEPPTTPPATAAEPPKDDDKGDPKPPEDAKKDEEPATPPEKPEETPPKPTDEKKPEEGAKPPETPETPPEPAQPLTKDDVSAVIKDVLNNERMSSKELDTATKEVMDAYYPEGLSDVLVDQKSGKELRTPQDVVDVTNGQMTLEEAAQWLMNEDYKLKQQIANIQNQAREVAETTVNFKRDSVAVLQKYEPLFKAYPHLQTKAFNLMMKQVKVDKERNVILSAPDVMDLYDTYLEPYQQAFEYGKNKPATNPTPDPNQPPKPSAEDRMDEGGDGGASPVNDPNDFGQQVNKELAKPL